MNTPIVDPPIVRRDDLRLLLHQDALSSVFGGLRKSRPWQFVFGSFEIPRDKDRKKPIEIPTPHDGPPLILHWRVDLSEVLFDLAPAEATAHGYPNPFTLTDRQAAIFARILVDIASEDTTTWRERLQIDAWLLCEFQSIDNGDLVFRLSDIKVRVEDIRNSSLLNLLNLILGSYLKTAVVEQKIPIGSMLDSDLLKVTISGLTITLNAVDCSATVQPKN